MVIENRQLLNRLHNFLEFNYKDNENFRRFCNIMSDYKKTDISFDELVTAVQNSWQPENKREEIIDVPILTKSNVCYKYRVPKKIYEYLYESIDHYWNTYIFAKDFLDKSYTECKDFYEFITDEYKTISRRTMNIEPDYIGDNITFFGNIKNNQRIRKFCRMIDNLNGNDIDMYEIFEMYRTVYSCIWGFGKYHVQELIIYDAVISFFKYPEVKRKQVKFFDFLIVDIMKKYVMGHKKLDVTEMFPHEDLLPCPFCGKVPHIYMKVFWFDLIVTIDCADCYHIMSKHVIESSGLNQMEDRLYINSFKEVINALVEKWNHRIKNDDMWLDDDTLPEELPECEPDMPSKIVYAPGLKPCPFCGSKAGFKKNNSAKKNGKRDPEGIKTIKVVCSKGCFSASHFGTPERVPDKDTIGYMAYKWNQRYYTGIKNVHCV